MRNYPNPMSDEGQAALAKMKAPELVDIIRDQSMALMLLSEELILSGPPVKFCARCDALLDEECGQ